MIWLGRLNSKHASHKYHRPKLQLEIHYLYSQLSLNGHLELIPGFLYSLYLTCLLFIVLFAIRQTRTAGPTGAILRGSWLQFGIKVLKWFTYSLNLFAIFTSPIIHLVWLPKFCKSIILCFSWDHCYTQEKSKTKVMQSFGWANKVYYRRYANGE